MLGCVRRTLFVKSGFYVQDNLFLWDFNWICLCNLLFFENCARRSMFVLSASFVLVQLVLTL